jgi:hypothetical protein
VIVPLLINSGWVAASHASARRFCAALRRPGGAQAEVLRRIIAAGAGTEFGRMHGFDRVDSARTFAARVPVRSYEEHEPWIHRLCAGEEGLLTRGRALRLLPTGGSTSGPKLIPYTAAFAQEMNRAIKPWIWSLLTRRPSCMGGRAYWSISPQIDIAQDHASCVPIGFESDTGHIAGPLRHAVDAIMAVPSRVAAIPDLPRFRQETLRHLLSCPDLRIVSVWHPSFLLLLLDELAREFDRIAEGLPSRRRQIVRDLGPDPVRLWPCLCEVSCWADGASAAPARELARRLPHARMAPKGLVATEGIVSLPFASARPLAVRSHFLEFRAEDGEILLAEQLEVGGSYEVVLTTGAGLYRYALGDRVRVTDRLHSTPCVEFIGRCTGCSDLRGEKLDPVFVEHVVDEALHAEAFDPAFRLLAPVHSRAALRYVLFHSGDGDPAVDERIARHLERRLQDNPHYRLCRRLGQLEPAAVLGDAELPRRYTDHMYAHGARLGDIKPPCLHADPAVGAALLEKATTTPRHPEQIISSEA